MQINELKTPKDIDNFIDEQTYINYRCNMKRGCAHDWLCWQYGLSEGKAELFKARYEVEHG